MKDTVQDNGFFANLFNCVSSLGDLFMSATVFHISLSLFFRPSSAPESLNNNNCSFATFLV